MPKPKPVDSHQTWPSILLGFGPACFVQLKSAQQLRDHLDQASTLQPCLITDAKALCDSFHKESLAGASSVDKRAGLEIRVAKEQLTSLGGTLRWVSSER